ncbi:Hsp70 family protein [Neobacillus sp. Marseille-QA0830]
MSIYLGIDFGTSTLCVTRWKENNNQVEMVPPLVGTGYGKAGPIENVIFYDSDEEHLIGAPAIKKMELDPHQFVSAIKREIEGNGWQRTIFDQQKTAVDVAADIFSYIRERVENMYGGNEIDGVVVSVPFAFGHRERQKIKQAAQIAKLPVLALIEEPVAAALSCGIFENKEIQDREKVLVFDFGGGTLDITIFEKKVELDGKICIEVITTDGHKELGGKDIDQRIIDKLISILKIDLSTKPADKRMDNFRNKISHEAEELKKALTYEDEYPLFFEDEWGEVYDEIIERDSFDEWIQPDLLVKIKEKLEDTLDDIDLEKEDIPHIVLVGGSSRIIAVQELISDFFDKRPIVPRNMEELVGLGAAMYCGMLVSGESPFKVIQKVSHSTGINQGGRMKTILPRNTTYGKWSEELYSINKPSVAVYQGNSSLLKNCSQIGVVDVTSYIPDVSDVKLQLGTNETGAILFRLYKGGRLVAEDEVKED